MVKLQFQRFVRNAMFDIDKLLYSFAVDTQASLALCNMRCRLLFRDRHGMAFQVQQCASAHAKFFELITQNTVHVASESESGQGRINYQANPGSDMFRHNTSKMLQSTGPVPENGCA